MRYTTESFQVELLSQLFFIVEEIQKIGRKELDQRLTQYFVKSRLREYAFVESDDLSRLSILKLKGLILVVTPLQIPYIDVL